MSTLYYLWCTLVSTPPSLIHVQAVLIALHFSEYSSPLSMGCTGHCVPFEYSFSSLPSCTSYILQVQSRSIFILYQCQWFNKYLHTGYKWYWLRCVLQVHSGWMGNWVRVYLASTPPSPCPNCTGYRGSVQFSAYVSAVLVMVYSASTALSTLSSLYHPGCILQVQP